MVKISVTPGLQYPPSFNATLSAFIDTQHTIHNTQHTTHNGKHGKKYLQVL